MHFLYILIIPELVGGLRVRFGLACVSEQKVTARYRSTIQREENTL